MKKLIITLIVLIVCSEAARFAGITRASGSAAAWDGVGSGKAQGDRPARISSPILHEYRCAGCGRVVHDRFDVEIECCGDIMR